MDQLTTRPAPEKVSRRWHQPMLPTNTDRLPDWAYNFVIIDVLLYAFRDTLTASIRYYLNMVHLSPIWFVPDLMAFVAFAIFAVLIVLRNRSILGFLLLANVFIAAIIGAIFMNQSVLAFFTGVKAVIPLFVGLCLGNRLLTERRSTRIFLFTMMTVSIIGIVLNPYFDFPWVGAEINNFGFTKTVGKLWWSGEQVRYGGFAGDSTMAGFMVIFPYFLLSRDMPKWANILIWPVLFYALSIATSKTAQLCLATYVTLYSLHLFFPYLRTRILSFSNAAKTSFLCVIIPFLLIVVIGGIDLTSMDKLLYSLQDRINNSWQLPFQKLSEVYPAGLFTGCGLGCFSYPMDYTFRQSINNPIDNFYINTYLMLGVPFIIIVIGQIYNISRVKDEKRLIMVMTVNIYTMMISCYGPSFATIMVGYAFSTMFTRQSNNWSRRPGRTDFYPAIQT